MNRIRAIADELEHLIARERGAELARAARAAYLELGTMHAEDDDPRELLRWSIDALGLAARQADAEAHAHAARMIEAAIMYLDDLDTRTRRFAHAG